jgi:acetyltransferase-like isoleucine patch superfamily enzyme
MRPTFFYKQCARFSNKLHMFYSYHSCKLLFNVSNVQFKSFIASGIPNLTISPEGTFTIGEKFVIVNDAKTATLGKSNPCKFIVEKCAMLVVGDNVGMSNTTIVATNSIKLGNNILIGGGTTIVDTDFHSLNPGHWHTTADIEHTVSAAVIIKDNVFIGMNCIVLKGVTIGSNVIVAAGAVVTKSIPDNEIWGGNPAVFLKQRPTYD